MKRLRYMLVLLLLAVTLTPAAVAQRLSVDFRQAANKHNRVPAGEVYWINSIVQRSNSIYTEGMSVPQRLMLVGIPVRPGNNHLLTFSHQATKSGKHAYDYLTSYKQALDASDAIAGPTTLFQLNECGEALGPPKTMPATCATIRSTGYSYTVDIPDAMGILLGHSVASSIAAYEASFGNRTLTIHGDAPILSAMLRFDGYGKGPEATAGYTLMWNSKSSSILIEMAGHLGVGIDVPSVGSGIGYGPGLGSGSIKGASFHFKLDRLDGISLGNRDNQVMGSAIAMPLTCDISGTAFACAGSRNTYGYANAASGLTYAWSLSNNTSGASIVGPATGATVSVDAGLNTGGYTLTVTVSNGTMSITCPTVVTVDAVTAAAQSTPILCHGGTSTITISANGGTPPYKGTGTFSRGAGSHLFTVTDANGCTGNVTVSVTEPPDLGANSLAGTYNCTTNLTEVEVKAHGGKPPYKGTGRFYKGNGIHHFTVTDGNGCDATTTITITQPASVVNASAIAAGQIQCFGGTTTVTVSATGGTTPYQGTGTFTLGAGTHSFTVTDANGCTDIASITLTEPASAINVSAVAASQIQCHGGTTTVDVTATGGTPPYQGTGSFTLGAGTHSFTVTDANGCSATASITLT
ncbi:MAG: hypothetical protein RBU27_13800, partial [Bacteroidota bacterium]|nr:hypothetical protein [Bacteroidota bacterium]